ncbi:sigma-54 interaction domain-containing protein [Aeoliella mucimassa]|uniref:Transcriptional regulatory protein QseF n=1 Tax=Aeoliella mucimassa TaxID=2527972 RepID=A0A518AV90_9BACT|nr:sigma-54 dependent transcriptional regulator [Aeoliella mucimassa]QDU58630.1 Transcriptional regulatory protein QseF [Aeoliella mucimassa]
MASEALTPSIEKLLSRPPEHPKSWVLGSNPRVTRIASHAEKAAEVQCPVLITGETGTGKEVWARLLHELGPRRDRLFVPVNCAALTPTLAESQLFGHEKGAFTGAAGASMGVFRAGNGGIVFLDEVGEMPAELQPKLLRVLQENEVTPVGAAHPVPINVQIIAATNRDLEAEVAAGRFREDLYYRLNMVELEVPPLRHRADDIPRFIEYFSMKYATKYQRTPWTPSAERLREFCEYTWPGNIRQLGHVIEQAYVLDCEPSLPSTRTRQTSVPALPFTNLAKLRRVAVQQALQSTRGHKGRAAKLLGIHANTMTRLLAQIESEAQDDESADS